MPERVGELDGFENNLTELEATAVGSGSEATTLLRRELIVEQSGAAGYTVGHAYITRRTSTWKRGALLVEVTNTTTESRCGASPSVTLLRQDGSVLGGSTQMWLQGSMGVGADGAYHATCLYAGETAFINYGLAWQFESYDLFVESARARVHLASTHTPGQAPAARFVASNLQLGPQGTLRVEVTNVGVGAGRFWQRAAGSYVLVDSESQALAGGGLTTVQGAPEVLQPGESAIAEESTDNFTRFSGTSARVKLRLRFYDPNQNCRAH
jgi:hypothetical protein